MSRFYTIDRTQGDDRYIISAIIDLDFVAAVFRQDPGIRIFFKNDTVLTVPLSEAATNSHLETLNRELHKADKAQP